MVGLDDDSSQNKSDYRLRRFGLTNSSAAIATVTAFTKGFHLNQGRARKGGIEPETIR